MNTLRTGQLPGSSSAGHGTNYPADAHTKPGVTRDPGLPAHSTGSVSTASSSIPDDLSIPGGSSIPDDLHGSVAPRVQMLIAALDVIDGSGDGEGSDSSSQGWGTSGLGAGQVSEADIEALARLHHRLTAQIGRFTRGPVSTSPGTGPANAGSLVPPHPSSDHDPASVSDPDSHNGGPVPGVDADGDRPALPFGAQTTLVRRGWRPGQARTVIAAARLAARYPDLDRMWRAGDISAEAVFALHQTCRKLTDEQETSFMTIMLDHVHDLTYPQLSRLTRRVLDLIRPDSIDKDDEDAYHRRSLTFSTLGDTVLFQGQLPKLEGQAFQDTITAIAEQQRAETDLLTAGQRKADALTELIVSSSLAGRTPALGGLPVAVTLTLNLDQAESVTTGNATPGDAGSTNTGSGDGVGRSRRGANTFGLDPALDRRATYPDGDLAATATTRFAMCCAGVTPITCTSLPNASTPESTGATGTGDPDRIRPSGPASLHDRLLSSPLLPLAVGRTQRLATPAQRKALAVRDAGCVIPGCDVQPNRTQSHHVTDYSLGGPTNLDNLASLCWVHHRQVDHQLWRLTPNAEPQTGPYWAAERDLGHLR